jgi:four helix bundle protein
MIVNSYRDLKVWQKAMDLVIECYRLTQQFPKTETYGLSNQLQRAAVSVPANIAEGHGRESLKEYLYYLSIANGSLMELETHLLIAQRLNYLSEAEIQGALNIASEVGKMLSSLSRSLKTKLKP